MSENVYNVSPGIEHLITPIDDLVPLPNNYHHGDVDAVAKSYERFGQRKSITGQKDQDGRTYITAGNTQWMAAKKLGWTHIAVEVFDDDHKTAIAWALADNRTAELGYNDDEALAGFMAEIEDDIDLFDSTGYDLLDYEILVEDTDTSGLFPDVSTPDLGADDEQPASQEAETPRHQPGKPIIQYTIIFDDEEQQQVWFNFLKQLRRENQSAASHAERIVSFIERNMED